MFQVKPLAAYILMVVVLAACAGSPVGASTSPAGSPSRSASPSLTVTSAPSPSASTIVIPAVLRGGWTAVVKDTSASSGAWGLRITDVGMDLQNPVGGDPFGLDPTAITNTTLTLPVAPDCPDQTTPTEGTYTYTLDAGTLTFTSVADSCGDRRSVLTAGPWTRKP